MGVQIPPGLPFLSLPAVNRQAYWQALEIVGAMEFSIKEKFEVAKQFLREVKTELKKVTWPSRKDTLSGTLVVLVAVFIIAIFLGIVDSGLSNLIKELLKRAVS
jgi:preprotein translocase subunit SecE